MSRILEQLKQAEEQRERLIAERKRLETEADAAQAEREREESYRKSPAARAEAEPVLPPRPQSPQQQSRLAAGLAMAAALAVVFWVGTLVSRPTTAPVPVGSGPAARAPEKPAAPELFKYDRDVDAFAARLREKGLQ